MTKHDIIMLFSSPEVALLLAAWSAPRFAASVLVQPRKFTIHGLPGKSDKSDWLRIRNEYSDANAHLKGRARHLGTRMDRFLCPHRAEREGNLRLTGELTTQL